MLRLNTICSPKGATHKKKRLGRGAGSGLGQTSGRGDKGQLARSGGKVRPGFEGGQTPVYRRLPKKGFKRIKKYFTAIYNVGKLEHLDVNQFKEISLQTLSSSSRIKGKYARLSILGSGVLTKPFHVRAHKVTSSAQEKIKKAGGTVEILSIPHKKDKVK